MSPLYPGCGVDVTLIFRSLRSLASAREIVRRSPVVEDREQAFELGCCNCSMAIAATAMLAGLRTQLCSRASSSL